MAENYNEKVAQLLENDEFRASIENAGSLEKVAELFTDAGYEVTADDIRQAAALDVNENGELTEDALENVSGGWIGAVIKGAAIIYVGYKLVRGYIDGARDGYNKHCR